MNQENQNATNQKQIHREKEQDLIRKMTLLKEAVRQQRKENCQLEDELHHLYEEIRKKETEGKKRDDKNESLLLEIRVLRDILIAEKNEREELQLQLEGKPQQSMHNGLAGLRSFFR